MRHAEGAGQVHVQDLRATRRSVISAKGLIRSMPAAPTSPSSPPSASAASSTASATTVVVAEVGVQGDDRRTLVAARAAESRRFRPSGPAARRSGPAGPRPRPRRGTAPQSPGRCRRRRPSPGCGGRHSLGPASCRAVRRPAPAPGGSPRRRGPSGRTRRSRAPRMCLISVSERHQARAAADDLRVHGQREGAVLGVERVEFGAPGLGDGRGRLHGPAGQGDRVLEERRVIEHPGEGEFDQVGPPAVDGRAGRACRRRRSSRSSGSPSRAAATW